MRILAYLRLGRVSNLPTVWTNVLAGAVLAGGRPRPITLAALAGIVSLFYVGGMFLNDAFDREIDARERPERPIPSGQVSAFEVFAIGFGLLAIGIGLLSGFGTAAALAGAALAGAIVLYDAWHKTNPLSPVVMGACRALVYTIAALATEGRLGTPALLGALALWSYLIGLTYIAKQETLREVRNLWPATFLLFPVAWDLRPDVLSIAMHVLLFFWMMRSLAYLARRWPGDIGRAVLRLLAGICLLDGAAVVGRPALLLTALACFGLTRLLHRVIPGT